MPARSFPTPPAAGASAQEWEAEWDAALTREWLVTDGLGGFASGTVLGPNTRRYHGVLVAPLAPPLGRHVLVAKLEETLAVGNQHYPLSANEFHDGTVAPRGFEQLSGFDLVEGIPTWRYAAGGVQVTKRVWAERGHSTTFVSYTLEAASRPRSAACTLHVTPLCVFRDFHRETIGSEDWRFRTEGLGAAELGGAGAGDPSGGRVIAGYTVRAYGGVTPYHLLFAAPPGAVWSFDGNQGWWWHVLHRAEQERGLDFLEDLYGIGTFSCALGSGQSLVVAATVEEPREVARRLGRPHPPAPSPKEGEGESPNRRAGGVSPTPVGAEEESQNRQAGGISPSPSLGEGWPKARVRARSATASASEDAFVAQLRRAAHQFLVARTVPGEPEALDAAGVPEARTVLAGYHWFGDWGRDTAIALPGLALATGRYDEARAILRAFSRYVDKGMLPNRFPDSGAPLGDGDYNTVDATLWYFHAIHEIDRMSGGGLAAELYPVLREIVRWHVEGTRFGIRVDPADGLVRCDNPQLTWMDAKVGDWVVTPRAGKPVEIAALWHHALALMEDWATDLGYAKDAARFSEMKGRAARGFRDRFWFAAGGYLYDVVGGPHGDDASLRPNQVIAAALPDSPLTAKERKAVVDVVAERLWTPRGLRTLAPEHPNYKGRYGGDTWQRDGAYHQGTVWPWLLGPLVDAHLRVYKDHEAARKYVAPLREHLFDEACAGTISEIFDGDAPHAPGGAVAQAWSVAEVYRAWMATEAPAASRLPRRRPTKSG